MLWDLRDSNADFLIFPWEVADDNEEDLFCDKGALRWDGPVRMQQASQENGHLTARAPHKQGLAW